MPTTLVLVRHGETDWNREHRFQGRADPPLNENGRAQSRALAGTLRGEVFAAAYTSPLRRARETSDILAAELGLAFVPHDALEEIDVGSWTGLTTQEVEARFPEGFARWRRQRARGWADGESYEQLTERVALGLVEIAATHGGGTVLAVTHGGPIRCAAGVASGLTVAEAGEQVGFVGNCSVLRLGVRDGSLELAE